MRRQERQDEINKHSRPPLYTASTGHSTTCKCISLPPYFSVTHSEDSLLVACLQAENNVVKQVEAEKDLLLAQVRKQMADMQRQHDRMAAELQRKLDW